MKSPAEVLVPGGTHTLAIAEARAFAAIARSISASVSADSQRHGELLAYLVNAGLAAELHFKALMIAARGGRVTKGHDLHALYREFPEFLSRFLEWQYAQLTPSEGWQVTLSALTIRGTLPPVPRATAVPKYSTFTEVVASSSRIFEDSRYFFERVHDKDWAIFAYAPSAIDAMLTSLDRAYTHLLAGDFAPKATPPDEHAP